MEMKTADKYEALRRIPEYIEDWKRLQKLSSELQSETKFQECVRAMKRKYRINSFPVPLQYTNKKHPYSEPEPVQVIPSVSNKITQQLTIDSFIMDDQYLLVQINLLASLPSIKDAISQAVEKYRSGIKDKSRNSKTVPEDKQGLWAIYDLYANHDKITYKEIENKFQVNPSSPEAGCMQIYRTVKKARRFIENVTQNIRIDINLPSFL